MIWCFCPIVDNKALDRIVMANRVFSETLRADLLILGGGVGGCAAALAALENGLTVVMTEEYAWIGGQFTSQAVPPDEHGWIESFGCTARYRRFREDVRSFYRTHYPLKSGVRDSAGLNPGNGWVSPLCHEPRVALAVLQARLAPYLSAQRLRILNHCKLQKVALDGADRIASVTVSHEDGRVLVLSAPFMLDATENGDLLPLAEVEHVTGSESRSMTGEPSAGELARPNNVQAISVCFVLDEQPDKNNTITPPTDYAYWRSYVPSLTPPWPGPLLSWNGLNPRTMEQMRYNFNPHREKPGLFSGLWAFRRIIDRSQFDDGFFSSDLCLVNWPMIDYMVADILHGTESQRAQHIAAARQLSLSMLHWLQTEAPRPGGGIGSPGLRLRGDITGTEDGLAMAPYIREARRIRAFRTITETDVSSAYRPGDTLAERYDDSVGVGYYRIDLHPSTGGDNYIDVPSLPFRIPLGALIPQRVTNLLASAKNIGTTHITNGCYRLHPVEWNIGESAALLIVYCMRHKTTPHALYRNHGQLTAFQRWIREQGVETEWPENLNLEDGDPHAHAR
jgi:hypothetical protein